MINQTTIPKIYITSSLTSGLVNRNLMGMYMMKKGKNITLYIPLPFAGGILWKHRLHKLITFVECAPYFLLEDWNKYCFIALNAPLSPRRNPIQVKRFIDLLELPE